jgi:hypothetical protein
MLTEILLIPSLLSPALHRVPEPAAIETNAELLQGAVVAIRARVGGKEGRFVIGYDLPRSIVETKFLGDSATMALVEVGNSALGRITPRSIVFSAGEAQGVLGRDVLGKFSIGFDVETGKVLFWPKTVSATTLAEWVGPEAKEVPLVMRPSGPCIEVLAEGRRFPVAVSASASFPIVSPALAKAVGFDTIQPGQIVNPSGQLTDVEAGAVGAFSGAGRDWPWLIAFKTVDPDDPGLGGKLRLIDFHGARTVVDLANRRLFHVPVKGPEAMASMVGRIIHQRLAARDGKLFLIKPNAAESAIDGAELLEFAGRPTEEWLDLLGKQTPDRAALLREFHTKGLTEPLRLRLTSGRIVSARVSG